MPGEGPEGRDLLQGKTGRGAHRWSELAGRFADWVACLCGGCSCSPPPQKKLAMRELRVL